MQLKPVTVWLTAHQWSVGVGLGERQRVRADIWSKRRMSWRSGQVSPLLRYHPGVCRYYREQGCQRSSERHLDVWRMGGNQPHIECISSRTLVRTLLTLFLPPICLSCRTMLWCVKTGLDAGMSFEKCEAALTAFAHHHPCPTVVMPRSKCVLHKCGCGNTPTVIIS